MRKVVVNSVIVALIGVFLLGAVGAAFVSAAQAPAAPGQGLEISPPVIELKADPGQTVTAIIRVRNVAAGVLIARGRADDFSAGDKEDGQPKLLLDDEGSSRHSLKAWVQGVPDLRLASQELKTATVQIKVPANAEPGGHFGVIRFTATPPDVEGTGVALSASVGTLVLLRVSGQVIDKASLAEFGTYHKGKKTGFFETGPIDFVVRVKNEGTVHEKVQGTIDVTDTFGGKVGTVAVNEKGGNVLPDSVRRFEQQLGKKGLFGRYTAKLKLNYLGGAQQLTGQVTFWVIPWKLIGLVIIGLIVLIVGLRWALRKYNAYIISQARR